MKACRSRVASVKRGRNGTNKSDDEKKEQKNEEHRGSGYAQMSLRASRAATIEKPEKMQEATGQEKQTRAREGWRERDLIISELRRERLTKFSLGRTYEPWNRGHRKELSVRFLWCARINEGNILNRGK